MKWDWWRYPRGELCPICREKARSRRCPHNFEQFARALFGLKP